MYNIRKKVKYVYSTGKKESVSTKDFIGFKEATINVLKNAEALVQLGILEKKEEVYFDSNDMIQCIAGELKLNKEEIAISIKTAYAIGKYTGRLMLIHFLHACYKIDCKIIERVQGDAYTISLKNLVCKELDCSEPIASDMQKVRAVFYDKEEAKNVIEIVKAYEKERYCIR